MLHRRVSVPLQRSRASESAEGPRQGNAGLEPGSASTEPRFGKRGRHPPEQEAGPRPACFNGAALRKARKAPARWQRQASCRRFNGAALRKARKARDRARDAPSEPLLQRSRASESAEGCGRETARARRRRASTEPRFGKRGRLPSGVARLVSRAGFNGAALRKARKAPARWQRQASCRRFNGAALRKARKARDRARDAPSEPLLQRSRASESAEGCGRETARARRRRASTEPRFGKRGRLPSGVARLVSRAGFNGAALRKARKG